MSYFEIIKKFENFEFQKWFQAVTPQMVEQALAKTELDYSDLLSLLSPAAADFIEEMAQKAHLITVQNFGYTIGLYTPIYVSNYCSNNCIYCGFNCKNQIKRSRLSLEEIETEAIEIAKTGLQHILLLTGEAPAKTPMSYLESAVKILKKHFASVSIEVFPMDEDDYRCLYQAGVDGLTIYQETYDRDVYKQVHLSGKKSDYLYRLDTPERGARAGFNSVSISCLFGLGEIRSEAFFTAMHAKYLQDNYPETEISLSLPRINHAEGDFKAFHPISDKEFVQFMLAYRLFLPRAGINLSTRESAALRDNLIRLGVTRYSAGSSTAVGGHSKDEAKETGQFDITDSRSVLETVAAIEAHGYQPVFKDWE